LRVAGEELSALAREPSEHNPKGELQELLQGLSLQSPSYDVLSETGPDHHKQFVCRVSWEGRELGRGDGQSKKQAEINAATDALLARRWDKSINKTVLNTIPPGRSRVPRMPDA
jgi:ribonuclease-3